MRVNPAEPKNIEELNHCKKVLSLAKNVLKALENRQGCLMENHGQLTIGDTIEEAISLTESLEKLSKQFFMCNLSKSVKLISKSEMNKVLSLFSEYKSIR